MSLFNRITTWAAAQILKSADLNGEFNNLVNGLNNLDGATTAWTNVKTGTLNVTGTVTAPSLTAWVTYTPTFSAGFGTVTNTNAFWRRIGDSVQIRCYTQVGTLAASVATVTIPSTLTIDYSKCSSVASTTQVGSWYGLTNTSFGSANFLGVVFVDGSATNTVFFAATAGTTAFTKANGNSLSTSNDAISFEATIPITGWTF